MWGHRDDLYLEPIDQPVMQYTLKKWNLAANLSAEYISSDLKKWRESLSHKPRSSSTSPPSVGTFNPGALSPDASLQRACKVAEVTI